VVYVAIRQSRSSAVRQLLHRKLVALDGREGLTADCQEVMFTRALKHRRRYIVQGRVRISQIVVETVALLTAQLGAPK